MNEVELQKIEFVIEAIDKLIIKFTDSVADFTEEFEELLPDLSLFCLSIVLCRLFQWTVDSTPNWQSAQELIQNCWKGALENEQKK